MASNATNTSVVITSENVTCSSYNESESSTQEDIAIYVTIPNSLRVVYFIISVFGFLVNVFTITIIRLYKPMHKYLTNTLIANQSLLDASSAAFLFFSTVYQNDLVPRQPGNFAAEVLCRIWFAQVPMYSTLVSSTYGIVAVAFERFLAVVHPIWHKAKLTRSFIVGMIVTVWFTGPLYYFPLSIGTSGLDSNGICTIFVNYSSQNWLYFSAVFGLIYLYILPLSSMAYLYVRMILKLRVKIAPHAIDNHAHAENHSNIIDVREQKVQMEKSKTTINQLPVQATAAIESIKLHSPEVVPKEKASTTRARRNLIKTLIIVGLGSLICWSWSQIYITMFYFGYPVNFTGNFFNFTVVMGFVSCCINPIIYCAQYKQFQQGVNTVLCRNRALLFRRNNKTENSGAGELNRASSALTAHRSGVHPPRDGYAYVVKTHE